MVSACRLVVVTMRVLGRGIQEVRAAVVDVFVAEEVLELLHTRLAAVAEPFHLVQVHIVDFERAHLRFITVCMQILNIA